VSEGIAETEDIGVAVILLVAVLVLDGTGVCVLVSDGLEVGDGRLLTDAVLVVEIAALTEAGLVGDAELVVEIAGVEDLDAGREEDGMALGGGGGTVDGEGGGDGTTTTGAGEVSTWLSTSVVLLGSSPETAMIAKKTKLKK